MARFFIRGLTILEKREASSPKRSLRTRSQSRKVLPRSSRYFAFAIRFSSEMGTPAGQTVSQRRQAVQSSIQSSTETSDAERNRCAPGPACFGPGKRGVTRDTGQTAMQVAQRTQTSGRFRGGVGISSACVMMRAPSWPPDRRWRCRSLRANAPRSPGGGRGSSPLPGRSSV